MGSGFCRKASAYTGHAEERKAADTTTPRVGAEPTISVFERQKSVHALDHAATGHYYDTQHQSKEADWTAVKKEMK